MREEDKEHTKKENEARVVKSLYPQWGKQDWKKSWFAGYALGGTMCTHDSSL